MKREAVGEGPTVEEALDAALEELGVQQDAVEYEVIEGGGKRLFGIGSEKSAQVKVRLKSDFLSEMEEAKQVARDVLDVDDDEGDSSDAAEDSPATPPVDNRDDEPVERTDEELDQIADEAVATINSVLGGFGIEGKIEEYEGDEGELILDVVGDDLAVLIGRHGKTLDGLQVLIAAITNRKLGYRHPLVIDVEGYRNRRREKLEDISSRAAERASRQGKPVSLRPMSSFERRIVHVFLRNDNRVATASEGDEPFRHVVVKPR